MKILIIHNFYTRVTGEDLFVEEISHLLNQVSEIKVVKFCEYSSRYYNQSLLRQCIGMLKANMPFYVSREFKKCIEREKPDIVQMHNSMPLVNAWVVQELKKRRIPVVFFVHNYRIFCPRGTCFLNNNFCLRCFKQSVFSCIRNNCLGNVFHSALYAYRVFLQRLFLKNIDLFVFPSHCSEQLYKKNVPGIETYVLKEFISLPSLTRVGQEKGDYVIFASRLVEEKGVRKVLEAASILKNITFKICGEGPLMKQVHDFIAEKKMKNVEVLGFMKQKDILDAIGKAKILLFPSLWDDVYPRLIREAMYVYTPVVASARGAARELIEHNKTGFLFDPDDIHSLVTIINQLWFDAALRERIASQAHRYFLSINDFDEYKSKLLETYTRVIQKKRSGQP